MYTTLYFSFSFLRQSSSSLLHGTSHLKEKKEIKNFWLKSNIMVQDTTLILRRKKKSANKTEVEIILLYLY